MSAVEKFTPQETAVATQPNESAAILSVIERAAMNPQIDVGRMQQLLDMQERVMARQARAAYDDAMAAMQPELPVIAERGGIKDRSGNVQSTYAKWEDINDAIKPVLSKHGFNLTFRTGQEDGKIIVTGVLAHRGGHREETTLALPLDTSGSKNPVQAVGSSTSYGQRYTSKALLNYTSRLADDRDDDGRGGGASVAMTDEQLSEIRSLIMETNSNITLFCKHYKIDRVDDLPASSFEQAKAALLRKMEAR